jgi:hypothetical protein
MMGTRVSQSSVYRWVAGLSFGGMFLKLSDQCIVEPFEEAGRSGRVQVDISWLSWRDCACVQQVLGRDE